MSSRARDIAERFTRLPADKRSAFVALLREQGIAFDRLPIVPWPATGEPDPMSPAQARQWFLWRLDPASTAYHIAGALRLRGRLDAAALRASFDALVERHESLRTVFDPLPDGLAQPRVLPGAAIGLAERDTDEASLAAELRRIHAEPFDLAHGPLLRLALLRLAPQEHVLAVVMHHIVSDGASLQVIVGEFVAQYRARMAGGVAALPPLPIRYADYARWQRHGLAAGEQARQLAYWTAQLGTDHPVLQLPTDRPRVAEARLRAARHAVALPPALVLALRQRAEAQQATLFTVLLAGWQALLARWSGQHDVRVGVPIANRQRVETEGLVGFFVNTQVLRNVVHARMPLAQVLQQARDAALGAQEHPDLPFEQLVDALQPERSLGTTPLFQVLCNHQRGRDALLAQLPGLRVHEQPLDELAAQFELTLDTLEHPDGGVQAVFSYAEALFEPATIARLARQYLALLAALAWHPQTALGDVDLLDAAERELLQAWGANAPRREPEVWVHRAFERHARRRPDAPAVLHGDGMLRYGELNRRANRLAHRLIARGVGPETRVAVSLPRSFELVVALLAVLKAGGAYLPMDPSHPPDRLAFMRDDGGAALLLTLESVRELEAQDSAVSDQDRDPAVPLHDGSLAYVIYTSGSTGRPKGVAVAHGPLAMHCRETALLYEMGPATRELHFLSFSFDGAHERLLTVLGCGASLLLRDEALWTPAQTLAATREHGVTNAGFPPAYLQALAQGAADQGGGAPLALLSFGGEAMPRAGLQAVREHLRPRLLINGYGPTEAVVTPVAWKARGDAAEIATAYVPIGRPCGDRTARVLDADMNLLPPGAAGELVLGGAGLARGYLGRAGLTAERFVADPFDAAGGRLYRTGDLVRWIVDSAGDAQLEYLGRIDQQVKVRGFRIELGEVEAQLMPLPGVAEAVASVQQGPGGTRLVAHVTARAGAVLVPAELRAQLAARLPDYLVPSAIAVLDALPLNPNGKVDRQALPVIEARADDDRYAAPQGPVEQALATLWAELLGVPRVGRHDNFFDLGGDSILSLQIVARMRGLGWTLTPRQVFERQTPALLAPLAQAEAPRAARAMPEPTGAVPLLPIQHEFFALALPNRHHWNQSLLLHSRDPLRPAALAQALAALVRHHDSLRLRFTQQADGAWHQAHAPHDEAGQRELLWVRRAAGAAQVEALCDEVQRSLDLSRGPLLRGLAIEVADGSWRLMLAVHHLVVDGVSWRILLEDLQTAYGQCVAGRPVALPPKTDSYQTWSEALAARMPIRDAAVDDDPGWASGLPCARPDGANTAAHQHTIDLQLDPAQTESLLKRAPAAYRTQVNDLLLTALGRALCGWSGHQRIRIDLEGHGREDLGDGIDLSRTVGWFTSLYPVVLDPLGEPGAALKRVKERLRAVPLRGLAHGLHKHLGSPEVRQALQTLPQAQLVFNYLGQFDGSVDAQSAWRPADERPGASVDENAPQAHEFSVDGRVLHGRLSFAVRFSRARHDVAEVQRFVDAFRAELLALGAHCVSGAMGVTPSDFPLAGVDQATLDGLVSSLPLHHLDDLYPLSPMQAGMLFQTLVDGGGEAYRTQLRVDLDGLDVARFRSAWTTVLARHEVLRSGFIAQPPLQWVARRADLPWSVQDWRGRGAAEVDHFAQAELAAPLDLAQPPLMRVALLRTRDDRHHVVWTAHHLLLDGWSSSLLLGEVLRAYDGATLPPPLGRFRDHIAWLLARDPAAGEAHWRAQLARLEAPTQLASALRKPAAPRPGQGGLRRTLAVQPLVGAARRERVTINTLVQAAWALVLARCTGQRTVCFGSTVAGRPAELPGAQQMLGLFINTLPVLATLRPAQRLGDWLRELQAQGLAAREHEHTPLVEIQRWAGQGGQALFDSLLVFENYPIDAALREAPPGGLRVGASSTSDDTHYALTLALHQGEQLAFDYRFAHGAFDEATVARLAGQVERVLAAFVHEPGACVGELVLLAQGERERLLRLGENAVIESHAEAEPVHRTIERLARVQPDATALVFGDLELSRGELNAQANRLAHQLIAQGVQPQACVGIALDRSMEMIVAVLAVLKAGAAYVPLDPAYPAERRQAMVEDSGIALVLAQLDADALKHQPASDPQLALHPDQLAYVIHTSGSTGRPKGVGVSHRTLARHVHAAAGCFGLVPGDRVLQFATLNFDAFVEQLFAPLAIGAAVVLRGPEVWDSAQFRREVIARRISVADLTTAYWQLLAQDFARDPGGDVGALRQVTVGGEAMSPQGLQAWRDAGLSHVTLLNAYGPTEATVTAAALDCTPFVRRDAPLPSTVPIGTALPGRALRIVDADLHPVPVGVAGELCIGGPLLARSYLGRPGLTAERFVADPFDAHGGRLYRTGDVVRWNDDGQIEYLGRLDHQVKLRGFRIELGEIEAALLAQPEVREAVVLARPSSAGPRLVAWVSLQPGASIEPPALRARLATLLPEHMLPSALVPLPALPVNPAGKVDRRALPEPDTADEAAHVPPLGDTEQALAALWCEVIGVPHVGRHDHFFELGGHSLLAVRLVAELRHRLGLEVPLRTVFDHPTLAGQAAALPAPSTAGTAERLGALLAELEDSLEDTLE